MTDRMEGKIAIVTGAAPRGEGLGNGKAMAMMLAAEGAAVVAVNRDGDRAQGLVREIESAGGRATAFAGDMTKASDVMAMIAHATEAFGGVDVLINNVGIGVRGRVEEVDEATWDDGMVVNVRSAMLATKHAIPAMRARGGGSIINISSIAGAAGLMSDGGAAGYAASKAALHGLTLSVAADYAAEQIRCNCLVVGSVHTPMVAHLGEEARERRRLGVPLKTEGTATDVGYAALYLASDESRWVTGCFLPVDGGLIALRTWPR